MNSSASNQTHHSIVYRPEIDGLRALAVLPVVLFHAHLLCPGGYVGVDVFFVISGYLITTLILRDLRAGCFSLAGFWERRIRRILPALSVMVIVTLLLGGLLFLPGDYERLGKSAVAQAMLVANLYFWRDDTTKGGYFGQTSEDRPLLHTWSLAVEEQFYLFFPLLLVLLFRFGRWREPRALSRLLLAGLLAGLALGAIGVIFYPHGTFYSLPTRAWELLCGAWIASLSVHGAPRGKWVREGAAWLGFAGILLPCWFYTKETPFPGLAALPPCVGAALFIWSNTRRSSAEHLTTVGRLLALRPVVFLGLISYSLYLWHWPILVLGQYWWLGNWTPRYLRIGLILVSVILAILSYYYVETPFRKRITMTTRPAAFRFAAVCTIVTLILGTTVSTFYGFPARLPEVAARNDLAKWDHFESESTTINDVQKNNFYILGKHTSASNTKILLWGDSHARCIVPVLDSLLHDAKVVGCSITVNATPPLLNWNYPSDVGLGDKTSEFSSAVLEQIRRRGITHVILAARWSYYQSCDLPLLNETLQTTIRTLHKVGCVVYLIQDVPDVDINHPKNLARKAIFGIGGPDARRLVSEHQRKNSVIYQLANQKLPATFIDPAPLLLDAGSDRYRADIDGVSIYFDDDHLTTKASLALLLPLLREAMADKLKEP